MNQIVQEQEQEIDLCAAQGINVALLHRVVNAGQFGPEFVDQLHQAQQHNLQERVFSGLVGTAQV